MEGGGNAAKLLRSWVILLGISIESPGTAQKDQGSKCDRENICNGSFGFIRFYALKSSAHTKY